MNATIVRTTRATFTNQYQSESFFLQPGTRCFVNPLTYTTEANGDIVKRILFDRNESRTLKNIEVVLADGRNVSVNYLLPDSQTTFFRTVVFDKK